MEIEMEAKHSPTPWNSSGPYIDDINGWAVADTLLTTTGNATRYANAARIVACVNACEGLSNEQLASIGDLVAQRDELLETLREMVAIAEMTIGWMPHQQNADGPLIKAQAAIAKAERARS